MAWAESTSPPDPSPNLVIERRSLPGASFFYGHDSKDERRIFLDLTTGALVLHLLSFMSFMAQSGSGDDVN